MQKEIARDAQTKVDSSRRRAEGPTMPKAMSERPHDTVLTVEQDKPEVAGSNISRI